MKTTKLIIIAMVVLLLVIGILGVSSAKAGIFSNRDWFDTVYTFDEAMITAPVGIIRGKVQNWTDFENSDMIQVKIDGKTYLTHSCNVLLISND